MTTPKLAPLAAPLLVLLACQQPATSGGAPTGAGAETSAATTSESERTRRMQEKAAELERRLAEIQEQRASGQITEQQAMDAILQLDAERRALLAEGESGGQ